jgi:hypothetical protein
MPTSYGGKMEKRLGRPSTNGIRDGSVLQRESIALNAYDESRKSGEKYEVAVDAMVAAVHRWDAEMPMSRTEAKRILANWRGKDRASTILGKGEKVLEGEEAARYVDMMQALQDRYAELKDLPKPARLKAGKVRVLQFGMGPVPR